MAVCHKRNILLNVFVVGGEENFLREKNVEFK